MKLVIEDETGSRREVPLEIGEITIGRDPSNHVQLSDRDVSRHHCRLFRSPDGLLLEDLESSNGLFVNGDVIDGSRAVQVGDRIEIGDYRILILDQRMPQRRPKKQVAASRRKPTPIPKFPGLPADLLVTPGPPSSLDHVEEGSEAPAAKAPAPIGDLSPGPRLAPLPAGTTPGPAQPVRIGTTPGPMAPVIAITPGPGGIHLTLSEGAEAPSPPPATAPLDPTARTPGPGNSLGSLQQPPTPGPANSRIVSRLVILVGELAGTSIPLPPGPAWLGSAEDAELLLAHPSVAPRHCRIERMATNGNLILQANAGLEVTVNGVASMEAMARSGDMIRVGSVLLRYVEGS